MMSSLILACSLMTTAEIVTFTGPDGWTFDARIHTPPQSTGPAVLMIGGGVGNDLEWSMPGSLTFGDDVVTVTINGQAHDDARQIVKPLVESGCTVMHYSTIAHEDPMRDEWPYRNNFTDPLKHMELARKACDVLIDQVGSDMPVVVIGHSMGGQRAVQLLAERPSLAGTVLLACAQATAMAPAGPDEYRKQRQEAMSMLQTLDANADRIVHTSELTPSGPNAPQDIDGDDVIRLWEVQAMLSQAAREAHGDAPLPTHDKFGLPLAESVLATDSRPCLMLYGTLDDAQGCHAPTLMQLASSRPHIQVRLVPEAGHQLGPESHGRYGPINSEVCSDIAHWITNQTWKVADQSQAGNVLRPDG